MSFGGGGALHDGRYETIVGSDVARDGMFLELWDRPSNELALWAFFSDAVASASGAASI